jgi:uncharacterized protein (TIGR02453 family)
MSTYFSEDFIEFFKELAPNNNKDWFDANRKRYVANIKEPFEAFVGDLIGMMKKYDDKINLLPRECIFRINRDIRFSKDKSPYKNQVSAIVSSGGKKDKTQPGIYVELSPERVRVYMGAHMLDKDQLYAVRSSIVNHLSEFDALVNSKDFIGTFGEVLGERNARLPKEFQEAGEKQPLVFNKGFYYFHDMDPAIALKDGLIDKIEKVYKKGKPLSDFLSNALNN